MILLNWIPEIALLLQLLLVLIVLNFRSPTKVSLPLVIFGISILTTGYFAFRPDLALFQVFENSALSDSFSYFGRMMAQVMLVFASVVLFFKKRISFHTRHQTLFFLILLAAFLSIAVMGNGIVIFALAWVGAFICTSSVGLLESGGRGDWVRAVRQNAVSMTLIFVFLMMLFSIQGVSSETFFYSNYIELLRLGVGTGAMEVAIGGLFLAILGMMVHSSFYSVAGPYALAISGFTLFFMMGCFWIRFAVPFFDSTRVIDLYWVRLLVGMIFSTFALQNIYRAVRTTEHDRWLAAMIASLVGFCGLSFVLPEPLLLASFYVMSIALFLTLILAGFAFHDRKYTNKIAVLVAIAVMTGAPPTELGFQFFSLIENLIHSGLSGVAVLGGLTWFGLMVSAIQMGGKVIHAKNSAALRRRITGGEVLFLVFLLVSVIGLTVFRPDLISLLYGHPTPDLW